MSSEPGDPPNEPGARVRAPDRRPPELAFDAFTSPEGQREFYGKDSRGWIVESRCDLRVGGIWSISFGPSPSELYRHDHVFEEIDRPHRVRLTTAESRLDGLCFVTTTEFTFEARGDSPTKGEQMSKSVLYMSMSLDGFIAGPGDDPGRGLGIDGECLHAWLGETPTAGPGLILHMSISLDGFAAHKDHRLDRLTPDDGWIPDHGDQRHRVNLELLGQIGLIVIGRRAYEDMVKGGPGSDNPMARLMNTLPKVVFSQSLSEVDWSNTRISRRPIAEEIPECKAEGGKDMVFFGGARLGQSLIRERLVDELRLTVHPSPWARGCRCWRACPSRRASSPQRHYLRGRIDRPGPAADLIEPAVSSTPDLLPGFSAPAWPCGFGSAAQSRRQGRPWTPAPRR